MPYGETLQAREHGNTAVVLILAVSLSMFLKYSARLRPFQYVSGTLSNFSLIPGNYLA
jgi:hypothetical protein